MEKDPEKKENKNPLRDLDKLTFSAEAEKELKKIEESLGIDTKSELEEFRKKLELDNKKLSESDEVWERILGKDWREKLAGKPPVKSLEEPAKADELIAKVEQKIAESRERLRLSKEKDKNAIRNEYGESIENALQANKTKILYTLDRVEQEIKQVSASLGTELQHVQEELSQRAILSDATNEKMQVLLANMRRLYIEAAIVAKAIAEDDPMQDKLEDGEGDTPERGLGGATKPVLPTGPAPVKAGGAERTIEEALEPARNFG
jgi:hypothetical protein